jgi:alkanesulfonate monooxygenase SsuD/methylene tetrahydromethanopterin reductase-like flavin-dependent oxidoreductase (luciferase family)
VRQMTLIGFLQAQNCTNFAGSWRHPKSRTDTLSPDYYRQIGRVLEEGKFHLGFFDDRLLMPHGRSPTSSNNGLSSVPATALS